MKAPPFAYRCATSLAEAMGWHAEADGEALYLAGGHSIVPSLALRMQAPSLLIDISRLAELQGITSTPEGLRIGALTPHAGLVSNPLVQAKAPLLAQAARFVAHPAICNRATFGGNLALADPASELPAAARCLRAVLDVVGPDGAREIPAEEFFLDLYATALEPGEVLRSILVPPDPPGILQAFDEFARRRGDFAMVGAAVRLLPEDGVIVASDICLHSVGLVPVRAEQAEAALRGRPLDAASISDAQAALAGDLDPADDPAMPAATRVHLAQVLLGRILARLAETSGEDAA